jgi:TRAP-type C4-dicarboxylate transport system permease large subunit
MNWEKIKMGMRESAVTIGALMLIIATASIYSWVLTKEMLPQKLANLMLSHVVNANLKLSHF